MEVPLAGLLAQPAVMRCKARLCHHQGKGKSVRNVLVAGSFLQQNSSTFEFSHYLLRRSHLAHKARSQCGTGWPTATKNLHPGWFVSNIPTGCHALRVSIKGVPGMAEEGNGCGCAWAADLHSTARHLGTATRYREQLWPHSIHTDSAGTLTPRLLDLTR